MSGQPGTSVVAISGVSKVFETAGGRTTALEDINLSIAPGEFVSLIGPSGCGKSTLLRLIGDLTAPTSGTVTSNGKPARRARLDRDYGIVFQAPVLFDWRTVQANVALPLEVKGMGAAERDARVRAMLDLVELKDFARHHPYQLSGGMQQRVSIARALSIEPSILLMDEPFGALDAETKWQMQELMIGIVETSKATVLLVTHDLEEAIFLADRIVFMSRHPGTVRRNVLTEFKRGRRFASHEEMMEAEGFYELEKSIMHLMRDEMRQDSEESLAAN